MSKGLPTKKPWNQWPDETDTAYDRFMAYLKMGADRSMAKVVQKYGMKKSYKSQLERWSLKYNWVDRCRAYDENIALQYVESEELIHKKVRSEILRRLPSTIGKLHDIAYSDDHDRMEAMEMIMNIAGLTGKEEDSSQSSQPTYQQIINHFTNHDS